MNVKPLKLCVSVGILLLIARKQSMRVSRLMYKLFLTKKDLMIKVFFIFFFSMHIARNLSATDVTEQLFVEKRLISEYGTRTFRVFYDPDKLAELRTNLGDLPSIQNSEDPEFSDLVFLDVSTEKYLFAPLVCEIVSDSTMGRILRTNGICNCIGIAVWTVSGSYMLHCSPAEIYTNAEGEIVMGPSFKALKNALQDIPAETQENAKVYLASSMFSDSFKLIKEQLISLGYAISGIAFPDIIQERHAHGVDYYINTPFQHMTFQEVNDRFVGFSTIMSMRASDGSIFVKHLLHATS